MDKRTQVTPFRPPHYSHGAWRTLAAGDLGECWASSLLSVRDPKHRDRKQGHGPNLCSGHGGPRTAMGGRHVGRGGIRAIVESHLLGSLWRVLVEGDRRSGQDFNRVQG
ncbi:hypothetical protein E2C01_063477 [Portunus trituberculatus]|uniref:Uncharacterized protein n=1 Tax=Portunus trituberculatus TaxID=210409 RepID=A0A5B7HAK4_PORTR|nr:hypothetical protein [Portunus trituberculatus]